MKYLWGTFFLFLVTLFNTFALWSLENPQLRVECEPYIRIFVNGKFAGVTNSNGIYEKSNIAPVLNKILLRGEGKEVEIVKPFKKGKMLDIKASVIDGNIVADYLPFDLIKIGRLENCGNSGIGIFKRKISNNRKNIIVERNAPLITKENIISKNKKIGRENKKLKVIGSFSKKVISKSIGNKEHKRELLSKIAVKRKRTILLNNKNIDCFGGKKNITQNSKRLKKKIVVGNNIGKPFFLKMKNSLSRIKIGFKNRKIVNSLKKIGRNIRRKTISFKKNFGKLAKIKLPLIGSRKRKQIRHESIEDIREKISVTSKFVIGND